MAGLIRFHGDAGRDARGKGDGSAGCPNNRKPKVPGPLRISHSLAFSRVLREPAAATTFDAPPRGGAPATAGMAKPGAHAATTRRSHPNRCRRPRRHRMSANRRSDCKYTWRPSACRSLKLALVWLWCGFGVALVWPWGGFVLRSLCLVYAYNM